MTATIYQGENFRIGKRASETVSDLQFHLSIFVKVIKEKIVIEKNFTYPKLKNIAIL